MEGVEVELREVVVVGSGDGGGCECEGGDLGRDGWQGRGGVVALRACGFCRDSSCFCLYACACLTRFGLGLGWVGFPPLGFVGFLLGCFLTW